MVESSNSVLDPKGTWFCLGSTNHFRLIDVGEMEWNIKGTLNSFSVAGCSCGGFLALFLQDASLSWDKDRRPVGKIELYTGLGTRGDGCSTINVESEAGIYFVAWNESQNHLIVVLQNGEIRFLQMSGEPAASSISLSLLPVKVISTGRGVVGLFSSGNALQVTFVNHEDNRGYRVTTLDISFLMREHDAIVPLLGSHSPEGAQLFLFFPSEENTTTASCCSFSSTRSPYTKKMNVALNGIVERAALSPSGERVALRTADGGIYVGSVDFEEVILVHLPRPSAVRGIVLKPSLPSFAPFMFCGDDAVFSVDVVEEYETNANFGVQGQIPTTFSFALSAVDGSSEIDLSDDIPEDAFFFSECDGIRIISSSRCHFLQIITPAAHRVCAVGSTAPGAVLRSAYEGFTSGNTLAVHAIDQLQRSPPILVEAIDDCIRTAAFEWDVESQQYFLRTAAFGKSFARSYDADFFVSTATKIRVRNTLKTVGKMIISHEQLQKLGEHQLARRLLRSGHHLLVWRICSSLHCVKDDILSEWMLSKLTADIAHQKKEEEAARELVAFLKQPTVNESTRGINRKTCQEVREIPFSELASVAQIHGKRAAALVLLDAEEVPTRQVPMLLGFGEPEKALIKAIAASDSDLIFTVIQYILRAGGSAKDVQFILSYPDARDILLMYIFACPHYRYYLRDYFVAHPTVEQYLEVREYLSEDRRLRQRAQEKIAAIEDLCITLQKRKSEILQRLPLLVGSPSELDSRKHSGGFSGGFGPSPGVLSVNSAGGANTGVSGHNAAGGGGKISERYLCLQIGFVEKQTQFAKAYQDERFLTASVADMLYFLLERGEEKVVEVALALRREYNVPEEMFQWARLKAFAATGRWDQVDQMGGINSRQKPALSGESFVTLLLSYDRLEQASKHIPRIPKLEDRLEYYVLCGNWVAAGEDCGRDGATELLEQLQARARGSTVAQEQIKKGWDMTVGTSSGINFGKFFS